MKLHLIEDNLGRLYRESHRVQIDDTDRIVILSDMHLGDGSRSDAFIHNSHLVEHVLKNYYLVNRYTLVLNGDIEELHRFDLEKIMERWSSMYYLFNSFADCCGLYKMIGNHDYTLHYRKMPQLNGYLRDGLRLEYKGHTLFVYHGHQASGFTEKNNRIARFLLRYLATPLGIKASSAARNPEKRLRVEKRAYEFSRSRKIVSIIGHTHRPLFESLSRNDSLKFKIEQLIREYIRSDDNEKTEMEETIRSYRQELARLQKEKRRNEDITGLYDSLILVPSLFNSGCTIKWGGITTLEIEKGRISLVYWFNRNISQKYMTAEGKKPVQLGDTDYYRTVLKTDRLEYIFSRVKLLS